MRLGVTKLNFPFPLISTFADFKQICPLGAFIFVSQNIHLFSHTVFMEEIGESYANWKEGRKKRGWEIGDKQGSGRQRRKEEKGRGKKETERRKEEKRIWRG